MITLYTLGKKQLEKNCRRHRNLYFHRALHGTTWPPHLQFASYATVFISHQWQRKLHTHTVTLTILPGDCPSFGEGWREGAARGTSKPHRPWLGQYGRPEGVCPQALWVPSGTPRRATAACTL